MYTAASTGQWQQFASMPLVNRKMVILKRKTERNRCYGYIWLSLDPIYIYASPLVLLTIFNEALHRTAAMKGYNL